MEIGAKLSEKTKTEQKCTAIFKQKKKKKKKKKQKKTAKAQSKHEKTPPPATAKINQIQNTSIYQKKS
jgi:hypothetical protein